MIFFKNLATQGSNMTKSVSRVQTQSARNPRNDAPPSKPGKLALAVSMAMGAAPVAMAFDNQVDVWVRPGTDRSYGGIEGVLPFSQSGTSLTFADLKFKLGQSGSYEGNLGLGHRFLTDSKQWALGFYGAWDHRNSANNNAFNQIAVGAEAISDNLDFRANYYYPLTDRAFLDLGNNFAFQDFSIYQSGIWEEAMRGFDVEAGVLLPISDKWETRAYAAYYNFEGKDIAPETDGWRVRLEVRPTNNIAVSLSHQQDDMFKDQTSLEVRYTFGKDGKSGVRSLKERMTTPWTRDIDIVVSTPQEGAANSSFGRVVQGLDGSVVHIDSAYTGTIEDGSYEHPYKSVANCEAGVGTLGKCHTVGGSVVDTGVTTNTTVSGDYNTIRLWEGTSQTDGGYTPITLLNGQMLAGAPITARNIVFMHNDPTVAAYRLAHGLPNVFDSSDPVVNDPNHPGIDAPIVNGMTNGGAAIQLGSNTSVLGVGTINGGIYGENVSGKIDLFYNQINNYYTGGGIDIANMNVDSTIRIMYNDIATNGTGMSLSNIADGGSATMNAGIYRNNIWVDGFDSNSAGIGIALTNAAVNGTATMNTRIGYNNISVAGNGAAKYADGASVGDGATGIGAANMAKYYTAAATATMNTWIYGNNLWVYGSNGATGVTALNASVKITAGDGTATATQNNFIFNQSGDGYDGNSGFNVTAANHATGIAASNLALGGLAQADQRNDIRSNTINVTDLNGVESATGVALNNFALNNGYAYQRSGFAFNTINATSNIGNATGISALNASGNKYNVPGITGTNAHQVTSLYHDTINATSYSPFAQAYGIKMQNLGVAGQYYNATASTQTLAGAYAHINATANDGATGIHAENGGKYYGGVATLNQGVYLSASNVAATANEPFGDAAGIALYNNAGARMNATQNFGMYQLDGVSSSITATANGANGGAYGIGMMNTASARGTASQTARVFDSSITATANGYYSASATGIRMFNSADSSVGHGLGSAPVFTASAIQNLTLDNVDVTAITKGTDDATGVFALNDGNSRYYHSVANATQNLNFSYVNITAIAPRDLYYAFAGGSATGIEMRNDGYSQYYAASSVAGQTLSFNQGSVIANGYYDTYGINIRGNIDARGGGSVVGTQTATLTGGRYYDGSSLTISATSSNGNAYGFYVDNSVNAYGGSNSMASSTQTANLNSVAITATSTTGFAYGIGLDNHVDANGLFGAVSATGGQELNLYHSSVTASSLANGNYGERTTGIYAHNNVNAEVGATATGTSAMNIGSTTISATSTMGDATGIYVHNDSFAYNGSSTTATQSLNLNGVTVTANAYYTAIGINAHNHVSADGHDGSSATGTQTITANNVTVTATGTYDDAIGINLHNSAYADGANNGTHTATASQTLTLNNSTVSATAQYYAAGIYAHNEAGSQYYLGAVAAQTVMVDDSSVTATGTYAIGIYGYNQTAGEDGSAFQTIAVSDSTVTATSNVNKYNGAAIRVWNHNDNQYAIASQALTVTGSTLNANGSKYMDGVQASTYGQYSTGTTVQSVTLVGNAITAQDWGTRFVADSYSVQSGTVVINTITAPGGLYMYADSSATQFVTVTGNSFSSSATTNAGSGTCLPGGQCTP